MIDCKSSDVDSEGASLGMTNELSSSIGDHYSLQTAPELCGGLPSHSLGTSRLVRQARRITKTKRVADGMLAELSAEDGSWTSGVNMTQAFMAFRCQCVAWLICTLAIAQSSYAADPSSVRVVGVHDGDTITCLTAEKRQMKVRLDAIDAPELAQPFGQRSKQTLSGFVFGKNVTVIPKKTDKYGRTIGHVLVNGEDVNLLMLQAGMAWHYRHFSSNKALQAAEDAARAAKQGLWSDPNAVPPWEWRRGERNW